MYDHRRRSSYILNDVAKRDPYSSVTAVPTGCSFTEKHHKFLKTVRFQHEIKPSKPLIKHKTIKPAMERQQPT